MSLGDKMEVAKMVPDTLRPMGQRYLKVKLEEQDVVHRFRCLELFPNCRLEFLAKVLVDGNQKSGKLTNQLRLKVDFGGDQRMQKVPCFLEGFSL